MAPQAATTAAYRDLGVEAVPGTGHLAAVVPGTFGAWMHLLGRYGTKPLAELAGYAVGYARHGHPTLPRVTSTIEAVSHVFREHWTSSAGVYLAGGAAPAPGSRLRNPDLADTLERLGREAAAAGDDVAAQAEAARAAFYAGFVADAVDAFARTPQWDGAGPDGERAAHRSFLTGADMAAWRASEEATASLTFGGVEVHKPGLWSQGPVLLQQLALLEAAGVGDLAPSNPRWIHLVIEASKLAMADREAWFGDSLEAGDPRAVAVADLLAPDYVRSRAALIGERALEGLLPGSPRGLEPRLPEHVRRAMGESDGAWPRGLGEVRPGEGEPTVARGDTCHLDVVDRWGNVVSATPSGGWLQSSPVVPGLGFSLPTRGQMFWLEEGHPASLRPGARPRTTLSPGLLRGADGRVTAFGTPGGDQQDQWTVPFLVRHLLHGASLQAAIDAPSWHSTHAPSSFSPRGAEPMGVVVESRLGSGALAELRARGHRVEELGPWTLGRISAAGVRADGLLEAAANPRGMQGYAVGR
ncbi:gamma-glutamyltranspeptidase [Litorihabitans aurantiacus]|uniref:Gamma-glutamyltranspeptidase n=1 Tax=Litorihabitans aurantiacus TaxID=1930061 RepID=A0AA38CTN7_9MICO|nr:gamma-glutamyltranspeptidase [Litorihabitans aurantiacus]